MICFKNSVECSGQILEENDIKILEKLLNDDSESLKWAIIRKRIDLKEFIKIFQKTLSIVLSDVHLSAYLKNLQKKIIIDDYFEVSHSIEFKSLEKKLEILEQNMWKLR